jgi:hypothetical protein
MTPDEAAAIVRSLETRSIEHTILLTRILKCTAVIAACSLFGVLILFFK